LTYRIEWVTSENNPPRQSGVLAEQILSELARGPQHIADPSNVALVRSILSLKQPLSFVDEGERLLLQRLAHIGEDGLPAAIEELAFYSDEPISLRRIRTLRVALSVIHTHIITESSHEWRVLQAFWDQNQRGLVIQLIHLFCNIAVGLKAHFLPHPRNSFDYALVEQSFLISQELLCLLNSLITSFPPPGKLLTLLVSAIADSFILADMGIATGVDSSPTNSAAQRARVTYIDAMHRFSEPDFHADHGKTGLELVLSALLDYGLNRSSFPATHRIDQVLLLIHETLALPDEGSSDDDEWTWIKGVLSNLLPRIAAFFALLNPESKCQLLQKIQSVDGGAIGLGEWLLTQELERIAEALGTLPNNGASPLHILLRACMALRFQFLAILWDPDLSTCGWSVSYISSTPQVSTTLRTILQNILTKHIVSPSVMRTIENLATSAQKFDDQFKHSLLLLLVRHVPSYPTFISRAAAIAGDIDPSLLRNAELRQEIGIMFRKICSENLPVEDAFAMELISFLSHVCAVNGSAQYSVPGVISIDAEILFQKLAEVTSQELEERLNHIKSRLVFDEDDLTMPLPSLLSETLQLSIQDIETALDGSSAELRVETPPSTPKKAVTPEIMNLVTTSPLSSLFHSPVASTTSLTKTYLNNDFRELRQLPLFKQSTGGGRHPSIHVDVS
jgi:hypothetical protein